MNSVVEGVGASPVEEEGGLKPGAGNAGAKRPSRSGPGKVGKFLLGLLVVAAVLGLVAHLIYKYSGSRQWEYMGEKNGVKLYSMKIPGETLKLYKAVYHVQATLSTVVAFMQDNDSELDIEFYRARELERHGPQMLVTTWRSAFPFPLSDRDFVIRHTFTQDPANKEIAYTLQSLTQLIPEDPCCVRVPRMDNSWYIMPKGNNNDVEITWIIDMEVGGFMPYFMVNISQPRVMTEFATHMRDYVKRPKYQVKLDWVKELGE